MTQAQGAAILAFAVLVLINNQIQKTILARGGTTAKFIQSTIILAIATTLD